MLLSAIFASCERFSGFVCGDYSNCLCEKGFVSGWEDIVETNSAEMTEVLVDSKLFYK